MLHSVATELQQKQKSMEFSKMLRKYSAAGEFLKFPHEKQFRNVLILGS